MDAEPKNQLCSICRKVDFETLYSGKRVQDADRASRSVVLGTHKDLSLRGLLCIFCRWITQNIEYHRDRDHRLQDLGTKQIKLCCDGSTVFDGRQQNPRSVSGHLIPIVRLRVEPLDYDRDMLADLRLVKLPRSDAAIQEPLVGEFVDSKITTVEQFKLWLQDCLRNHKHNDHQDLPKHRLTEVRTETFESIPSFTLIDVAHRRLVRTSGLKFVDVSYVALSYVWGTNAPAITLGPGNTLPNNLPATIEDTLTLVSSLELVPFLWIDSICIPQDDMEVRLAQIQKMDIIYDRAVATIIVTGWSVHSGITGISANNNPAQSLHLGPWLLTYQPGPWKHLMSTHNNAASHFLPWGSRGWTFQEALISPRKMILNSADGKIMFECSAGGRQTHPTDAFEQVRARFFTDLDTVRMPGMDGWNLHWYQHLLNLYLQRQLSYDRDIISAFTGVAKVISRAVGKGKGKGRTCWTLPRRGFLGGLMWAPTRDCKEVVYREERTEMGGVLDDGRQIPSWHWASVVMRNGVAFVQGSEPGQLYEGLRRAWTSDWTEDEWKEVEKTGRVEFRGEIVNFAPANEGWQEAAVKDAGMDDQGIRSSDEEGAEQFSRVIEKLALSKDAEGLIDNRQCAISAWRQRKGCFISCSAWAWAETLNEVVEPLAIYPFAHRLGNPRPMQPNRQFVLMVKWDKETLQGTKRENQTWRICRRIGWAVVDLDKWQGEEPAAERFWLA